MDKSENTSLPEESDSSTAYQTTSPPGPVRQSATSLIVETSVKVLDYLHEVQVDVPAELSSLLITGFDRLLPRKGRWTRIFNLALQYGADESDEGLLLEHLLSLEGLSEEWKLIFKGIHQSLKKEDSLNSPKEQESAADSVHSGHSADVTSEIDDEEEARSMFRSLKLKIELPKYDGELGKFSRTLKRFEHTMKMAKISEKEWLLYLENCLEKSAKAEYWRLYGPEVTYMSMTASLAEVFDNLSKERCLRDLQWIRQQSNESVMNFRERWKTLMEDLEFCGVQLPDTLELQYLLLKLQSGPEIKIHEPESIERCFTLAMLLERTTKAGKTWKSKPTGKGNSRPHAANSTVTTEGEKKPKSAAKFKTVRTKKKGNRRCFICADPHHLANDCPQKHSLLSAHKNEINSVSEKHTALNVNEGVVDDPRLWIIDSGASAHMTNNRSMLYDFVEMGDECVQLPDGSSVPVKGHGMAKLITVGMHGEESWMTLKKVLLVPHLRRNLLSVASLCAEGKDVSFKKNECHFASKNGDIIAIGKKISKLYILLRPRETEVAMSTLELWHRRFGHFNKKSILQLQKLGLVKGLPPLHLGKTDKIVCSSCSKGKMTRLPFPKQAQRSTRILQRVHTDVEGPFPVLSSDKKRYYVSFIDDYSRMKFTYLIYKKSEVFRAFKTFKAFAENQTGYNIRELKCDGGGEYISNGFKSFLAEEGIAAKFTHTDSPQENGVAERFNRTCVEMTKSMLFQSGLPKNCWGHAVIHATNILNYVQTTLHVTRNGVKFKLSATPFEMWTGKKADVSHLRVFGCEAFAHIPKTKRKKLDPKALRCVYIGSGEETKGYKLLQLNPRKVIYTRDVRMNESKFPLLSNSASSVISEIDIVTEPASFKEATSCPDSESWRLSMREEMNGLLDNGTFVLVPRPPGLFTNSKLSSAESEYMAFSEAGKEALYLKGFLSDDLSVRPPNPVTVYEDNLSCIKLLEGEARFHKRTKHIDMRYHFIRDHIEKKSLKVEYCPTNEMVADILTKPLETETFVRLRKKLSVVSVTDSQVSDAELNVRTYANAACATRKQDPGEIRRMPHRGGVLQSEATYGVQPPDSLRGAQSGE